MKEPFQEPSVLDFVKARLRFWEKSTLEIPQADQPPEAGRRVLSTVELTPSPPASSAVEALAVILPFLPWRSGLAVLLALFAQLVLEPRSGVPRDASFGAAFYLLAAGFALWAVLSREWQVSQPPAEEFHEDPLTLRLKPLIAGGVLLLFSFVTFSGNLFNIFNTSLWLAGLFLLARSLWLDESKPVGWRERIAHFFQQRDWRISLTPQLLVVLAFAVLALFFRAYRLEAVPPEMNSDHAEKLLDVYDVLHGVTHIFFERNTGREAFQFYLTALVAQVFGTGISFLSLKIGTLLCGLAALPFIYLLAKEMGGKGAGTLAAVLAAIAYWPNVITRVALRFTLYPLFVAPTLYFLVRGLRTQRRNDFILAGLALGIGLHTYTPIRILPLVVLAAVGLYLLHRRSSLERQQALVGLLLIGLVSFAVFVPLGRYAVDHPDAFAFRALSRMGDLERPLPAPAWQVFSQNLWNALIMFTWDNGEIWPISIPHRPALDVITAGFFILGVVIIFLRYLRQHHWQDILILLSIPLLMLPSILALAFPNENPALNRTSGAMVPVFVIAGLSLFSFLDTLRQKLGGRSGQWLAIGVGAVLLLLSARQNFNLVFNTYYQEYAQSAWNTSEMGQVIRDYAESVGSLDSAWVVAFPHWVDTRLVGMSAGNPTRDYAIQPGDLPMTVTLPDPKLFLVKPDDQASLELLRQLYPQGWLQVFHSSYVNKDFYLFFVPAQPGSVLPGSSTDQTNVPLP